MKGELVRIIRHYCAQELATLPLLERLSLIASPEEDLAAIGIIIPSHTRLQNPSLHKILHQCEDHAITSTGRHDVDSDRQYLVVQRDVAKILGGPNCKIRQSACGQQRRANLRGKTKSGPPQNGLTRLIPKPNGTPGGPLYWLR